MSNKLSDQIEYGSIERNESSCSDSDSVPPPSITTYHAESGTIIKSSIPLIITLLLQYSLTIVSIFSIGHMGKVELAAVSLATMTFNITNAIFTGMATCLDTLCSQAYGAGKKELVGLHFQRCSVMLSFISIPIIILWWSSGSILELFVHDKQITKLAQDYLRMMSFGTPGFILFETGKRFLQAQGIFNAGQYVLFISTPINMILNYLLVWDSTIGLGFIGAPLAIIINYNLMAFLLFCYVMFIDGKQCWNGLQLSKSLENWAPMISLALPGVIMVEAEFFAFELLTLASASLGTEVLAAQSIVSTLGALVFQIPFGVSIASSTRIATHIGSQSCRNAKIACKISINFAFIIGSISSLVLFFGRRVFVKAFTNDVEVTGFALSGIKILAINQLYDTMNVISAGCLRGQGRQKIGGYLNILCYYLISLPIALYLGLHAGMGLVGLWLGLGIGILVLASSETYFVFQADWSMILKESLERNRLI